MVFDNTHIRRQDRLLGEEKALKVLTDGEYGILSMSGPDGSGYGVPLNYVLERDKIYFHCAPQGEKLRYIKECPDVSFCVVGRTKVLPGKFSTGYESVIVSGRASLVEDDVQRMEALKLILKKYSPDFYEMGLKYSKASFTRVAILRLDINTITAKCKPEGL